MKVILRFFFAMCGRDHRKEGNKGKEILSGKVLGFRFVCLIGKKEDSVACLTCVKSRLKLRPSHLFSLPLSPTK